MSETSKKTIQVMRTRGGGVWGGGYYQYALMDGQIFSRFLSWTRGGHKLSKWGLNDHLPKHVELKPDHGYFTTRAALARAKGAS